MKVTCIYWPEERERMLFKRMIWVTNGKTDMPKEGPSSILLSGCLKARHTPIRVLNFAFLCEDVPSNITTHLARHVHAVPAIGTLRNDRQHEIDGDEAPRNTPVPMIFYCNAEELMTVSNKRLCNKAAMLTQRLVQMMCLEALDKMPELEGLLVPMCEYHGGVCHEIQPCGRCGSEADRP
jgi:hypothetical protein